MMFRLRPWQDADAFAAADLVSSNISRFMSDAFPGNDVEKWEQFIRNANENPSAFYRVIEVDGKFAGNIGIHICNDILRMNAELGYWIGDQYKCRGIMTEAVKEMVQLIFTIFEVTRIYATPFGNNFASQRVLEKAGFTLEAMFEKIYIKNGMKHDELVYAIRR
ncbi:MAG TPA: GNAT family protein [Paludibacter sp.]|nr:GNAT family protein [Paludibacter sp.]